MEQSYGNLGGAGGGSSSGGSNSKAAAPASSSSFLQLPLSSAAAPAGGVAYYGAPLALLHHATGPSSSQSQYGSRHAEISPVAADAIKAKIVAHPQYSALLAAFLECQKVGSFV
jgi:hypothetical protein